MNNSSAFYSVYRAVHVQPPLSKSVYMNYAQYSALCACTLYNKKSSLTRAVRVLFPTVQNSKSKIGFSPF